MSSLKNINLEIQSISVTFKSLGTNDIIKTDNRKETGSGPSTEQLKPVVTGGKGLTNRKCTQR